jgi:hypothetical protein
MLLESEPRLPVEMQVRKTRSQPVPLTVLHYKRSYNTNRAAQSERDAVSAQKLGQPQPLLAVFPQECMGQLAPFGRQTNTFLAAGVSLLRLLGCQPHGDRGPAGGGATQGERDTGVRGLT